MPSKTAKQARTMRAAAHNPAFAKKVGIPVSVAKDFAEADKGRKFGTGGRADLQKINKPTTEHGKQSLFKGGGMATKKMEHAEKGEMKMDLAQDKKMIKKAFAMHDKQEHKGSRTDLSKLKKGGKACMATGGMARMGAKGEHAVQKKAKQGAEMVKMAKGGLASGHKSADGIAVRGKTRGMQAAMCGGGMARKGK